MIWAPSPYSDYWRKSQLVSRLLNYEVPVSSFGL